MPLSRSSRIICFRVCGQAVGRGFSARELLRGVRQRKRDEEAREEAHRQLFEAGGSLELHLIEGAGAPGGIRALYPRLTPPSDLPASCLRGEGCSNAPRSVSTKRLVAPAALLRPPQS